MKRVRVRYAPSPTGHLHIGNARTALFNYLFAKHYDGDFVLRVEDTDIARNVEGGEESQLAYLSWLGIEPDESPSKPKDVGPYRQMERLDIYQKYANLLIEQGYAYRCYCTEEQLELDYQRQKDEGVVATMYNRKCLHLSKEEIDENQKKNLPFTVRMRVPENHTYEFDDIIRRHVSFESKDIGDWVLIKQNGIPTYNFAVVIDDHLMNITHVFRGEEHLSNTPKQLMLYDVFGWEPPKFGHMTLIVNEQRKKLSKRDQSILQYMSQYKELGYLPEAMFNFMALLGWSPIGEQEIFTKDELIEQFDETRLSKSPSMFDVDKLTWINNRYVKNLPLEQYRQLVKPYLCEAYDCNGLDQEWIDKLLLLYQDQLSYGKEIVELAKLFFAEYHVEDEEAQEVLNAQSTKEVAASFLKNSPVNWEFDNIKETINLVKEDTKIKGKPLFMGLRVAASGQCHGPDLVNTLVLLGKEKVEKRLSSI